MYVNVAMNFNQDYNPLFKEEEFKYRIVVLVSKVILAVSPSVVKDIFELRAYLEMQSYQEVLRRYRPAVRIKTVL